MKAFVLLLCIALPLVCAVGKPKFPHSYSSTANFFSQIKGKTTKIVDGNVHFDLPNRRIHLQGSFAHNQTHVENFDFFLNGTQYIIEDKVCVGYELQGQYGDPLRLIRYTHYNGTIEISRNGHSTSANRWIFKQGTVRVQILTHTSNNDVPMRASISQGESFTVVDYFDFTPGVSPNDFALPNFCFDMMKRSALLEAPSMFHLVHQVASSVHI